VSGDARTDRRPSPELGGATEALVHERASATPAAQAKSASGSSEAKATGTSVPAPKLPADASLRALEQWFIEAVTSPCPGDAIAPGAQQILTRGPALDESGRLEIYRYAYRARLVECLADDYPALQFALGEEAFEALCGEYIQRHPSSEPSLNFFGRHMARFCRSEASSLLDSRSPPSPTQAFVLRDFAADLAELEWALVETLHAKVADALSAEALSAIPVERWPAARLPRSPAVRVLRSGYAVNAFFQAFKTGEEPALPAAKEASVTAVYRTDMTLWRMALTPAMAGLLEALFQGETLGDALGNLEQGLSADDAAEAERSVMVWFREWVAAGFFARVDFGDLAR
jgi:hypothetical protein